MVNYYMHVVSNTANRRVIRKLTMRSRKERDKAQRWRREGTT